MKPALRNVCLAARNLREKNDFFSLKTRRKRVCGVLVSLLLSLAACSDSSRPVGDGRPVSLARREPSAAATAMDVSAPLNLHISIGGEPSCRLKGPSRVVGRIKTEMEGNTFRIFTESRINWSSDEVAEAWVTIPHLQALHTAGAGDIVIDTRIDEPEVKLDCSGAVDLDIADIRAARLELDLSGAASVLVRGGEVGEGRYSISGTGDIRAFGLKTQNAVVSVAGAGRAALTAVGHLDAEISGTGMIRYKGNPVIEKSISGIGALQDAN